MNMLGLDADTFAGVNRFLRGETIAVMLFGSVARGDDSPISDTDILQLTSHYKPSYRVGRVSISVYTPESLEKIALKGSLFALHLKSEGRILYDPDLVLSRILDCYRPPCSYDPFLRELAYSLNLLNVSERVYREHPAER